MQTHQLYLVQQICLVLMAKFLLFFYEDQFIVVLTNPILQPLRSREHYQPLIHLGRLYKAR